MNEIKQVIVVNTALNMRRGKEAAQVAHASMEWLRELVLSGSSAAKLTHVQNLWLTNGHAKIVVGVSSEDDLKVIYETALASGILAKTMIDLGHTEFHGKPTMTSVAIGPDYANVIDPITSHLKLR